MNSQDIPETEAFLQGLSGATGVAVETLRERIENLTLATATTAEGMSNLRHALMGEDSNYQKAILFAMNRLRMPIYSGTVEPEEIARRRKANKAARISRRKNRK